MGNIFFGIITLSIVVVACVFIHVLLEVKKTSRKACDFLQTTEASLEETLEEVKKSLRSIRGLTENVTTITDDIKVLSSSVRETGHNIRDISRVLNSVVTASSSRFSGLRAAIKAGSAVLLTGFLRHRKK
ncbi:MAG: DUF948 domain-containing protein [Syntrophorhabdaceae bacterium]|nr:DUF948 domain-containing protein [Syntrophorhabdaceae bacterium]